MRNEAGSAEDCGCAPTPGELRTLKNPVSRRMAIGFGGLGVLGIGALALGAF